MANLGSKSKGPFGTIGSDYKVVSTIFPPFSDRTMSHVLNFAKFEENFPSAETFFIAARQCYFEMKTIKQMYFSILSSLILWCNRTLIPLFQCTHYQRRHYASRRAAAAFQPPPQVPLFDSHTPL